MERGVIEFVDVRREDLPWSKRTSLDSPYLNRPHRFPWASSPQRGSQQILYPTQNVVLLSHFASLSPWLHQKWRFSIPDRHAAGLESQNEEKNRLSNPACIHALQIYLQQSDVLVDAGCSRQKPNGIAAGKVESSAANKQTWHFRVSKKERRRGGLAGEGNLQD